MIAYGNIGYLIKFLMITNRDTSLLNAINVFHIPRPKKKRQELHIKKSYLQTHQREYNTPIVE